jgi:urea transporter
MLNHKWSKLVETNTVCDFVDTLLRGYGQILFYNNPLTGLILLIGFLDSPISGILGLIGGISALAAAILIRTEKSLVKSGLFGCSGGQIGFAFSVFLPLNLPLLIPSVILSSILAAIVTRFLINTLSIKHTLPVLSIPFVILTWLTLLALQYVPHTPFTIQALPKILWAGQIDQFLIPILPGPISDIFRTMSAIFFQNSILIGILSLLGIIMYSRISTVFGVAGGALGIALFNLLSGAPGDYFSELTVSFNCALIAIALGGFFIILNWQSILYTALAVFTGALTGLALINLLGTFNIPPLAAPFNLVTLVFLYILKAVPVIGEKAKLERIPLVQASKPEAYLNWHPIANMKKIKQTVKLQLPFYGTWYVSCGNNRQPTHHGASAYAWDFVVLDEQKKLCRGTGTSNEDYYSYGLPVLAPAPGTIVKVTNSIPDNTPTIGNWEQSWGNYLIIDHGNNEFSEISHFRQGSIVVKEGDKVTMGQLLGYCGNSGLSLAPHIHYQLQSAGRVGANTIHANFHNYATYKGTSGIIVKEGIPKEKEFISNLLSSGDNASNSLLEG